jgi:hypothetical protein
VTTASNVINIAASQVGVHEGFSDGHWNNIQKYSPNVPGLEWSQGQAWCATFVSWVFRNAGMRDGSYPVTASVNQAMHWWKEHGRFSEYPAIGAQVIYGVRADVHTGIVVSFDNEYIYTIEGNTNTSGSAEGDGVYRKTRRRRDDFVYGYGYPEYDDWLISADPAWRFNSTDIPFPGRQFFYLGAHNDYVTQVDNQLIRKGFTSHNDGNGYQAGPDYTSFTRDNVADFQRSQGWSGQDADGLVGPETWKRLHN